MITDFLAGSDDIDLSALATAPNSFTFRGTSAFAASGQQVRFFQTKTTNSTTVEVDTTATARPTWQSPCSAFTP